MNLPNISLDSLNALKKGVDEKHHVSCLNELGVSQKVINILDSVGVSSLEQLLKCKKEELLSIPNFGEKQMFVLFEALSNYQNLVEN